MSGFPRSLALIAAAALSTVALPGAAVSMGQPADLRQSASNGADVLAISGLDDDPFSIYTVALDTRAVRRIGPSGRVATWGPDGRLAYIEVRSDLAHRLVVVNAGGTSRRIIAGHATFDALSWSPDGRLLAFNRCAFRSGSERCAMWTIRPDGTHARRITPDGVVADGVVARPSWSPDSKSLVFIAHGLMRVDVETRALRRLTRANDDEAVWSPDGKTVAFVRAVDELSDYGYQLYAIRADGRGARRLTNKFRGAQDPSWSPDGTRIAFAGRVARSRACGERGGAAIFSLTLADHSLRRLSAYAPDWIDTAWSPDGSRIAARRMSCSPNQWWNLYVINEAGGGVRRPVGGLRVGGPIAWRPSPLGTIDSASLRGQGELG